jgi:Flavoprotein
MNNLQQPIKILLGVTGSVAAVKSPEIAVVLCEKGCDVCVLLSAGGLNFWEKSSTYNPEAWGRFEQLYNEKRIRVRRTLRVLCWDIVSQLLFAK